MQCVEFKHRLDVLLDRRQLPEEDAKLRAHARHCLDCADWLAAHENLLGNIAALPPVRPSADFSLRVLQTVETERQNRRRWRSRAVAVLAVAAACLLAVLSWGTRFNWHSDDPSAAPTVNPSIANNNGRELLSVDYAQLAQKTKTLTDMQLVFVGKVAEGFKPVTSSVITALNSLFRTVPGNEAANVLL